MSERQLMRKLRMAQKILGSNFSRDNFRKLEPLGFPKEYAYRKRFGSWGNTVIALQKMYPNLATDPKTRTLMFLHKAKSILGDSFTRDNYRHLKGFPSEYQIIKQFGSWKNAIEEMNAI